MKQSLPFIFFLLAQSLFANNVVVSNTSVLIASPAAGSAIISFDVAWENSWRTSSAPNNWDAVWSFAKYRLNGGPWLHASISSVINKPSTATIDIKDGVGVMIYRNSNGTGDIDFPGIELQWTSPTDFTDTDEVELRVYAIEMVYVPQGSFMLGNNKISGSDNETRGFSTGSGGYLVTNDGAITSGSSSGNLRANGTTIVSGSIPATYPEGYNAFYSMKYEVSQALWVAFFNTLANTQKANRDITSSTGKNSDAVVDRNGVAYTTDTPATTSLPSVPISFVSRNDGLAFLDWAALRPMTEMEFEKASKGPSTPSPGWFAWGNTSIKQGARYQLANTGTDNETVTSGTLSNSAGNAVYGGETDNANVIGSNTASQAAVHPSGVPGPFRTGAFAGSSSPSTRVRSGASYYGVMELSGNVAEGVITVANSAAVNYTGNHGDGTLDSAGNQNEGWPTGIAIGHRGGWFSGDVTYMMTADRSLVGNSPNTDTSDNHEFSTDEDARLNYYQMRGVRD